MNNIFVFGSNLAGRHGKGAALHARNFHGAIYGKGEGRQGRSYAIPTKDYQLNTLPLTVIEQHIATFLKHARNNPQDTFLLTPIGTGLAGYEIYEILDILNNYSITSNVVFTKEWFGY
jgi:hypothetical protein